MDDRKWEQYAALGGVLFVVANIVGAAAAGEPPAPDDSAAEIAAWFTDKHDGILLSQALAGIGSIGLVWWAGTLWRRMSAAEIRPRLAVVSLLGLAMSGALYLTANGMLAAAALRIDELGEGSQIFFALNGVLLAAAGFFVAVHVGATSALGLRTRSLPAWLCWLGALDALAFVVAGVIGSSSDASAAMVVGIVSFLAWSIWTLGVSVTLWRDRGPAPAVA